MLERHETTGTVGQQVDRRSSVRRKVTSLSYIQVGEANNGILLDISEGGLSFQPLAGIEGACGELHTSVRFQLPHSSDWIESTAKTVWTSEERVVVGLQFVDLPESARAHIREWIRTHDPENESNTGSSETPPRKDKPSAETVRDLPGALTSAAPTLKALNESGGAASVHTRTRESLISSMFSAPGSASQAMNGPVQVVVKLPSRWVVPLLVSLLVVSAFALGVSVGHGFLDHWLGTAAPEPSPSPNATAGAGGSSAVTVPNGAASDAASPNVATDAAAPPKADENTQSTPPSASRPTAPSFPDGRPGARAESPWSGMPSQGHTMVRDTAQGPVSLFIQPEHSVSANATTAISSSRSIALPAAPDGKIAAPPRTFHFGPLLNHSDPSYPPEAIGKQIEGTVELRATIGSDGSVVDVQPLGGPEALVQSSTAAVRLWRYQPTYVNGHSVETSDTLRITFRLPR